jgi:hypothetical protein
LIVAGIIADLISVNRKLLERVDYRLRRIELGERAVTRVSVVGARKALAPTRLEGPAGEATAEQPMRRTGPR